MFYLALFIVVAAAGIGRLWWHQGRQRSHLSTVDGFRTSLERLSDQAPATRAPTSRAPSQGPRRPAQRQTLDPERRAAAKRRIQARRKALRRAS